MAGRFSVETVFTASDRMSGTMSKIESRASRFEKTLHGANSIADKGGEIFSKFAAGAAVVGAAAGGAFAHIISTGADFEQSITNVGAVMGKSRSEIGALEKAALSLGVSTQFSSSEVSEAMEQMARKGFDSEEILAGIPGVLNAIAASGEGMAEVATVVGSSIRGFGLDAKDASHVADVLAFSAEKTGAHITDMGFALATAAPTARALGVSIEDTAAAVGLLQKMGLDASVAGSSVSTMLTKLSHPSKDAAQQMAALGLKFQDAKGNMLPFRDVLGQFVKVGDKSSGNMKRMAFFQELVGLRGEKAALALADMAKSGDFDKLAAGLQNVDGYSAKVAKIRLDTTGGSWKLLTSTVEVLETKLFNLNNGGLKDAIDKVNAWIAANSDLVVSGAAEYVGRLTETAGHFVDYLNIALPILENFKNGLRAAFTDAQPAIDAVSGAISGVFGGGETGPLKQAYDYGKTIGDVAVRFGEFWLMTKAVSAATTVWAFVTGAAKFAMIALDGVVWLAKAAWFWYNVQVKAGAASTVAMAGANVIAQGSLMATRVAAFAAAGGFTALAGAIGVAGVAYLAYQAVKEQNDALKKETGGKGFFDVVGEAAPTWLGGGGKDFKSIADENLDKQAKERRAAEDKKKADAQDSRSSGAPGIEDWVKNQGGGAAGLLNQLATINTLSGQAPVVGAMPPIAAAGAAPGSAPVVSSLKDAVSTNQEVNQTLKGLPAQIRDSLKGANVVVLKLPPGVGADTSGAPGVSVQPSGGY